MKLISIGDYIFFICVIVIVLFILTKGLDLFFGGKDNTKKLSKKSIKKKTEIESDKEIWEYLDKYFW